jgi:hypothetical protein
MNSQKHITQYNTDPKNTYYIAKNLYTLKYNNFQNYNDEELEEEIEEVFKEKYNFIEEYLYYKHYILI